jgi:hypothetical protein
MPLHTKSWASLKERANHSPPRILLLLVRMLLLRPENIVEPIARADTVEEGFVPCLSDDLGNLEGETDAVLE